MLVSVKIKKKTILVSSQGIKPGVTEEKREKTELDIERAENTSKIKWKIRKGEERGVKREKKKLQTKRERENVDGQFDCAVVIWIEEKGKPRQAVDVQIKVPPVRSNS